MMGNRYTEPVLSARNLSKAYGESTVLNAFTHDFVPGEVVGLVGANGAGKSTAGRILAGALQADSGGLRVEGKSLALGHRAAAIRRGLQYVPQELDLCDDLTIWENVAIADDRLRRWGFALPAGGARRRTTSLLSRVGAKGLRPYTRVGDLSFAERQLVAIARALASDPRFIVFDEPTASLGEEESKVVQEVVRNLASDGAACAFISHRTAEVLETCDSVIVLRDGLTVDISRTIELTEDDLERSMFGEFALVSEAQRLSARTSVPSLTIKGATVKGAFDNVNLIVNGGEVLGVYGLAGAGIGSLLRGSAGLHPLDQGSVSLRTPKGNSDVTSVAAGRRLGLCFLSMDRSGEGVYPGHSTALNIESERLTRGKAFFSEKACLEDAMTVGVKSGLGSNKALYSRNVERLSGGQQQKALFARRMAGGSHTWVMDEPLGGIDVKTKRDITTLIRDRALSGDAILISTGDLTDLTAICDRVIVMRGGRTVGGVDAVGTDGQVSWTHERIEQLRALAVR